MSHPPSELTQLKLDKQNYVERNQQYWQRNLAICVFGSFTTLISLSMLLPFLPLYVQELGVSSQASIVQWAGVAFGATFFGTAITAPIWGRFADRYGRKLMLVRAAVGMAITMSLIGTAHNIWELVALRLIAGLLGGYASASTMLIATQAPRSRAGWALGVLSTGALAGNLIGPLVGGYLPGLVGIRNTFFIGGAIIAVAALATMTLVREDFDRERDARIRVETTMQSASPGQRRTILALLVTAMSVLLANMSIEPIITVFIAQLDVPKDDLVRSAGIVMACSALGAILMAPRLGALADRIGAWKVIIWCLLATALALLPQAFVQHFWQLAVCRFVMGMTLAGLLPSIAKVIRHSVDERQLGTTLGYLQSAQFSGQVIGPLLGGQVGAHVGLRAVFVVTSVVLLMCALINYWIQERRGEVATE